MNLQDFWQKKLSKYSQEEWATKPSIFATQVIKYFPSSGSLVDLGAGIGQDSQYFAEHGFQVLATDLVASEAQKIISVDLSQPLPFSSASFDVVYCHLSLHFFDTQRTQQLFDEIFSVLKPGGVFATLTNTLDDPEVSKSQNIGEDLYLTPSGLQKRFFSVESMKTFTTKFETLLLDNLGETHKDETKSLIRFVGRKPLT
jgi:SAM-dependent methyltransferase